MNCDYNTKTLTCKVCGHVARRLPTFRECRTPPSLTDKAVNFAKATARHVANRGRQCTDSEIAARYAICEKCPLLVDAHCTHKNCGCAISPKRAIVSKLSWASESCPAGKWSAITCQDSK